MTRRSTKTLYRLIEAGQRAHMLLLRPLIDRGLAAGDDAVLFVLGEGNGATEEQLSTRTGLHNGALTPRIDRLVERDLVCRRAVGPALVPGLGLTDRGERVRAALEIAWAGLEESLVDGLDPRDAKHLERALKRFVNQLRAAQEP